MKNNWSIIFVMMLALMTTTAFAQTGKEYEEQNEKNTDDPFEQGWKDKLVYGGNIFPGYNNGWILDFTPFVGYKLTNTTVAGVGANYFYRSFRDPYTSFKGITRMYGGRAFIMQDLLMGVFGQAEYDYNYIDYKQKDRNDNILGTFKGDSPGFLIGGGYSQRNGRIGYNLTVLYDVLYSRQSVGRNSPLVIRGGIILGM